MGDPTKRGWQIGKSLADCHRYMFDNQISCDVKFKFESADGAVEELGAHKYILLCRSPVFEAMMSENFKESTGGVTITDVDIDVFREMLRYLYCDEAKITGVNIHDIMFAAKKYILQGLVDKCKLFMKRRMTEENVCTILSSSILYDEQEMINDCLKYISKNTEKVLGSDDFNNLSKDALNMVAECDELNMRSEKSLLRAMVQWAKVRQDETPSYSEMSLREIMGNSIFQVRFARMCVEEFSDLLEEFPDVLTHEEQAKVFQYIARPKYPHTIQHLGFTTNPRTSAYALNFNTYTTPSRFRETVQSGWSSPILGDGIAFVLNRAIRFRGVKVFGTTEASSQKNLHLRLWQGTKHLASKNFKVADIPGDMCDSSNDMITVLLDHSEALQPGVEYELTLTGNDVAFARFGRKGQEWVTVEDVTFSFVNAVWSTQTSVRKGQFPQIIFSMR